MRPVHEFKANFSQAELATDKPPDSVANLLTLYDADSSVRNLCFVWPDGRRLFLNYAYLLSGEFVPKTDGNLIKLNFSAHNVALHGYGLEMLFLELLDHLPRTIEATDGRYARLEAPHQPIVVEIIIEKQND